MFWKGIYLTTLRINPMDQYNLYFYLKNIINLTKQKKLTTISETSDILSKRNNTSFNIICFCDEISYERKFLELFSYKPTVWPISNLWFTSSKKVLESLKNAYKLNFKEIIALWKIFNPLILNFFNGNILYFACGFCNIH